MKVRPVVGIIFIIIGIDHRISILFLFFYGKPFCFLLCALKKSVSLSIDREIPLLPVDLASSPGFSDLFIDTQSVCMPTVIANTQEIFFVFNEMLIGLIHM